jgi:hypothetical protein
MLKITSNSIYGVDIVDGILPEYREKISII